jgi:excinuclease ABC subunit A
MGVLYVWMKPSIGLHPRDNARLLKTLMELRDIGNTVLIVEHDEETIRIGGLDHRPGVRELGEKGGEFG